MRSRHFRHADKDSDGNLSGEEITAMSAFLSTPEREKFAEKIAIADANSDGFVTAAEITRYLDTQPDPDLTQNRGARQMMAFDLDHNDEVDASEITRVVGAVVAKRAVTRPKGERAQPGDRADRPLSRRGKELLTCGYPEPSGDAEVVSVSAYEGYALSTVALDDTQKLTTVAVLQIEEGDRPLYLFVGSSRRVIFELRGDVGRVEQIVIGPSSGIVGVARERVYFAPQDPASCAPRYWGEKAANEAFARDLAVVLVQDQVSVVAGYDMGAFIVPGGVEQLDVKPLKAPIPVVRKNRKQQIETSEGGMRPMTRDEIALFRLTNEMRKSYPAGIHRLEAHAVVAPQAVVSYRVLPAQAGLIALIEQGYLRAKRNSILTIVRPVEELPAISGRIGMEIEPGVPLPRFPSTSIWIRDEVSKDCVSETRCPKG